MYFLWADFFVDEKWELDLTHVIAIKNQMR